MAARRAVRCPGEGKEARRGRGQDAAITALSQAPVPVVEDRIVSRGRRREAPRRERGGRATLIALLAVFVLLNLLAATHHLATEGWKSGLAETALCLWVLPLSYLAWEARQRRSSPSWRRAHLGTRCWLGLASLLYLALSLYHFTHGGIRSGLLELAASLSLSLLVAALS